MRGLLLWIVRLFGIYVFVRGALLLSKEWHGIESQFHRRGETHVADDLNRIGHLFLLPPVLLTIAGLLIILLAFRHRSF